MPEIPWERVYATALEQAKRTGKPIFDDFWFDG